MKIQSKSRSSTQNRCWNRICIVIVVWIVSIRRSASPTLSSHVYETMIKHEFFSDGRLGEVVRNYSNYRDVITFFYLLNSPLCKQRRKLVMNSVFSLRNFLIIGHWNDLFKGCDPFGMDFKFLIVCDAYFHAK